MSPREDINKELEALGSSLANQKLASPKVPNGYFEKLKSELTSIPSHTTRQRPILLWSSIAVAAAAALIGILLFVKSTKFDEIKVSQPLAYHEDIVAQRVDANDLIDFIMEDVDEIDEDVIEDVLLDDDYLLDYLN